MVSGRMRAMVRFPTPSRMPREVGAIIDAIGNRLRTEILSLIADTTMTATDLAEATGGDVTTIRRHLAVLEGLGLVDADRLPDDRGPGRGRFVLWKTNHKRAEEVGRIWINYVTGRQSPDASQE
jgi:DNA-binding transcriptional ArsR family regulator